MSFPSPARAYLSATLVLTNAGIPRDGCRGRIQHRAPTTHSSLARANPQLGRGRAGDRARRISGARRGRLGSRGRPRARPRQAPQGARRPGRIAGSPGAPALARRRSASARGRQRSAARALPQLPRWTPHRALSGPQSRSRRARERAPEARPPARAAALLRDAPILGVSPPAQFETKAEGRQATSGNVFRSLSSNVTSGTRRRAASSTNRVS